MTFVRRTFRNTPVDKRVPVLVVHAMPVGAEGLVRLPCGRRVEASRLLEPPPGEHHTCTGCARSFFERPP